LDKKPLVLVMDFQVIYNAIISGRCL